jgi:hypothetical protein
MGALGSFHDEVELSCCNHVLNVWDVMEDVSDLGVPYLLLTLVFHIFSSCTHVMSIARIHWMLMQKDFNFVKQALPK